MKHYRQMIAALSLAGAMAVGAEEVLFQDDFQGKLGAGWSWVREVPANWRTTAAGLEIHIRPGNLWGGANNVQNVLVRPAPETTAGTLQVSVTVSNQPSHQYEQVNLAWYYDDSHMVKLGEELVDGKRCVVMGREEADRTRTLGILPLATPGVRLRLLISGNQIRGQYQPADSDQWHDAGAGELPAPPQGRPKISLHCYQGPPQAEHWARFSEFRIVRLK